jgi:hypothetical protein
MKDERCAKNNTEFVSHSDESKGIPSNLTLSTPSVLNNQINLGIVIKRENSISNETFINESESVTVKVSESSEVNDQKLDDFEMLLDNASASSNIINKRSIVSGSSIDQSSENKITSIKSTMEITTAQVHDENSSHSNKRTDSVDTEKTTSHTITDTIADADQDNKVVGNEFDNNHGFDAFGDSPDDIYSEFIDEIKNDWLHFRPQTPPASPIDILFDSDFNDATKKFSIELQILDKHNELEDDMKNFTNNVFASQPLSFNYSNNDLLISDHVPRDNNFITIKKEPIDNDQAIEDVNNSGNNNNTNENNNDVIKKFVEMCKDDLNQSENIDSTIDLNDFICEENQYPHYEKTNHVGNSSYNVRDDPRKYKSTVPDDNNSRIQIEQLNDIKVECPDGDNKTNIGPIAELQTHNYVLQYGSPNNSTPVSMHSVVSTGYTFTNSNAIETTLSLTPTSQFISSSNALISNPTHLQNKIVYDSNTIVLAAHPRRQVNGPSDRTCKLILDFYYIYVFRTKRDIFIFSLLFFFIISFLVNQSKFKQVFMLDLTQDKRKQGAVDGVIKKNYTDLGSLTTQNILVSSVNPNILTSNSSNSITQQGQGPQQFSLVQNTLQKPIILSATAASSAGTILQTTPGANTTKKIIVGATGYGNIVIPSSNSSIILDGGKIITTNNQLQTQQTKILTPQQRSKIENNVNLLKESGDNNIIIAKGNNKSKIIQTANFISMQSKNVSPQNSAVKQITSSSIISNNKTIQRVQQSQFGSSSLNFQNTPTSSSSKMIIQQPNNGNNILGSVNNKDN